MCGYWYTKSPPSSSRGRELLLLVLHLVSFHDWWGEDYCSSRLVGCKMLPFVSSYFAIFHTFRQFALFAVVLTWFCIRKHGMQACNIFLSGMSEYRQNVSNPILCAFAMCLYKVPLQSALGFTDRSNYESVSAFIPRFFQASDWSCQPFMIWIYLNYFHRYCTIVIVSPIFLVAEPCETITSLGKCAIHWCNGSKAGSCQTLFLQRGCKKKAGQS